MSGNSAGHIKQLNSSNYDISKLSLLVAGVVLLLLTGGVVYIYYNNPVEGSSTSTEVVGLEQRRIVLAQSLNGADISGIGSIATLDDEVALLDSTDRQCKIELDKCKAEIKKYENPIITCGEGTEKIDLYCRKIGLRDFDFEARGIGVAVGIGLLVLIMN